MCTVAGEPCYTEFDRILIDTILTIELALNKQRTDPVARWCASVSCLSMCFVQREHAPASSSCRRRRSSFAILALSEVIDLIFSLNFSLPQWSFLLN
jgi:hypothetical protein